MPDQFDRFTIRARRVLTLAQNEAQRLNHDHIGPEHLLLGLVQEEMDIGCEILQILGISLLLVKEQVEKSLEPGPQESQEKLSLTPSTKNANNYNCSRRDGNRQ